MAKIDPLQEARCDKQVLSFVKSLRKSAPPFGLKFFDHMVCLSEETLFMLKGVADEAIEGNLADGSMTTSVLRFKHFENEPTIELFFTPCAPQEHYGYPFRLTHIQDGCCKYIFNGNSLAQLHVFPAEFTE